MSYVDLAYEKTSDGIYDLIVNADSRDLDVTDGLDSALFVSLFSDRRAYEDEIADPMLRRGWIGDLVSRVPGDRHGSGLWLYEQRRLAPSGAVGPAAETAIGLRIEAQASLDWLQEERLVTSHTAQVSPATADRLARLDVSLAYPDGSVAKKSFALAQNTVSRALVSAG